MRKSRKEILHQLIEVLGFYRGIVLDSVEQELGDSPHWRALRPRLLKAFGERGLENRVREILGAGSSSNAGETL